MEDITGYAIAWLATVSIRDILSAIWVHIILGFGGLIIKSAITRFAYNFMSDKTRRIYEHANKKARRDGHEASLRACRDEQCDYFGMY